MIGKANITFPVLVNSQLLTATVLEENDGPVETSFRVQFSDGFTDSFVLQHHDNAVSGSSALATPYAQAIQYDLLQVIELDTERFFHVFQHELEGSMINIWVEESQYDGNTVYLVSYLGAFHFAVVNRDGAWQLAEGEPFTDDENIKLFKRVGHMLDAIT